MRGFSFIELLIVLAIVGILGSIAYPSYQTHFIKIRRSDGQLALLQLAGYLEKFALEEPEGYKAATMSKLHAATTSQEGYYHLSIVKADIQQYLIVATPLKNQKKDISCGTLALDSLGQKGILRNNQFVPDMQCW